MVLTPMAANFNIVPTAFYSSVNKIVEKINQIKPDAVLMIGQA
ncbi:hypothetical protein HMPREF1982_02495 [Clostridiales bacterium oral taxon 876 str. F0540]|nr:hypothetical protein HMPREF1982_02495 [Clostridiales bacterium oral taxon 876 str. F0540]